MHIRIFYLVLLFLLQGVVSHGQTSTNSPYTRFGYGTIEQVGFGRNQGMGGLGIAVRSNNTMSPLNPASYSAIDTLSQIFEFGMQGTGVQYRDIRNSSYDATMNFNYLGVSFSAAKWWGMGVGITPFSSVGYDYSLNSNIIYNGDSTDVYKQYYGSGGISKLFWGNSFELFHRLSLGIHLNYYFGSLSHYRGINYPSNDDYIDMYSDEKIKVSKAQFTFGFQYEQPITEKSKFVLGGVYEPKTSFGAIQEKNTYRLLSSKRIPVEETNQDINMEYPESFGLGLVYEIENKFTIGADYYIQKFAEAAYYSGETLVDRTFIATGLEYTPNYISNNYLARVRYRLGANTSNNYQDFYGQDIIDLGITFGLGFPLGYSKTTLNVAFEYGKRGTTDYNSTRETNLVREDYLKVVLNLSLNDVWFLKRKFQ